MMILLYFDWMGTSKELKEWETQIREACEITGVDYRGLFASLNLKWNFVSIFETDTYNRFLSMGKNVVKHWRMPHNIAEVLVPTEL